MDPNKLLIPPKTIAMVGLSDKPERPSYQVAEYLISKGFTIIPVNPMIAQVFGLKAYPSFSQIPSEMAIDVVDIFRKSEEVLPIIQEVINSNRKPAIWMQEGVSSAEAKELAEANGLEVIMDMCMMKAHKTVNP